MYLKERDQYLFKVLDKCRVLDSETAALLCQFSNAKKAQQRLKILEDNGFLKHTTFSDSAYECYYYFLTQKAMDLLYPPILKTSVHSRQYWLKTKPPCVSRSNIQHEIACAKVLAKLLHDNPNLTLDDVLLDRDQQKLFKQHKKYISHQADIEIPKYYIRIEIEIARKYSAKLYRNILLDNLSYAQVWITYNQTAERLLHRFIDTHPTATIKIIPQKLADEFQLDVAALYEELLSKDHELKEMTQRAEKLKIQQLKLQLEEK